VVVTIPGPPFGDAKDINEAKQRFKTAWLAFKAKSGEAALAKAYADMAYAARPGRFGKGKQ
jgi:hypothetical protein